MNEEVITWSYIIKHLIVSFSICALLIWLGNFKIEKKK